MISLYMCKKSSLIQRDVRLVFVILIVVFASACSSDNELESDRSAAATAEYNSAHKANSAEVCFDSGEVELGSDQHYMEERHNRIVQVSPFCIDKYEVSHAQFAEFVEATGFVTVAETGPNVDDYVGAPEYFFTPGAAVFRMPTTDTEGYWEYVETANWKVPDGMIMSPVDIDNHPVTQVAFADAKAYAQWAGRDLPTEAEWEYAAKLGADNTVSDDGNPGIKRLANTWQGTFPSHNSVIDGYLGTSPVGSFPPDNNGLHDMLGNVWEWTEDNYSVGTRSIGNSHVIKGGSHLCSANFCARYRPSARQPQEDGLGTSHIGFRTVRRILP